MANNRIIYQSEALYVSSGVTADAADEHKQLRRVQSANYSLNVTRQDVNQFGELARIDSLILESPTVSFDTSYLLGNGFNEMALGFKNSTSFNAGFISGQIAASGSDRNFYILTTPEGVDINSPRADIDLDGSAESTEGNKDFSVIGIGNAFCTDYTLDASVGDFPTVSLSFEGTNMNASVNVTGTSGANYSGISGAGINNADGTAASNQASIQLPEAQSADDDSAVTALRPGDIEVSLSNADAKTIVDLDSNEAHVQSISLSIPMSRTPIDKLGSKFAFARTVDFPITPTLSVSAVLSEITAKALNSLIDSDTAISELQLTFKEGSSARSSFKLKQVKLDSESYSSSIGPNKTVDLTFSLTVGGPNDTTNNVFFSGDHNSAVMGNEVHSA